jgi:hypothetical protein
MGAKRNSYRVLMAKKKARDHLEGKDVDRRVISNWTVKE